MKGKLAGSRAKVRLPKRESVGMGGNMAAKQVFPPRGVAPAYIGGKRVTVRVGTQDNHDFSACSGRFEKCMQIPNADPSGLSQ